MSDRETHPTTGTTARPALTLLLITGIQLMLVLDGTIVNIALPRMGSYFDKSQTDMTWAVSAYTLAFGGLLLLGGRAGDMFGRRRILTVGLSIFTVSSLVAGMATTFSVLVAGRVGQGVGASLAAPAVLALLTSEFPAGPMRTRALAVYASVQGWGSAVGLLLGGVLTEYVSWRWVLFVNVPIGAVMIAGTLAYLRPTSRVTVRFDYWGAAASTGGMTALVYGFISAANNGWGSRTTLGAFAIAVFLLTAFVLIQSKLPHAMMPLRLFRDRNRVGAYIALVTITAGLAGQFFFVTYFYQLVLGFTALENGLASIPVGLMVAVGAWSSGKLLPRIGPRGVVAVGATFCCTGLFWLSTMNANTTYWADVLTPILLFSFGTGQMLVPLTTAAVSALRPSDMGVGSALVNVTSNVGGALGVSALATVFASGLNRQIKEQMTALTTAVSDGTAAESVIEHFQAILAKSFDAPAAALQDSLAVHAAHEALARATGLGLLTAALLILFGGLTALIMIRLKVAGKDPAASTNLPDPLADDRPGNAEGAQPATEEGHAPSVDGVGA